MTGLEWESQEGFKRVKDRLNTKGRKRPRRDEATKKEDLFEMWRS